MSRKLLLYQVAHEHKARNEMERLLSSLSVVNYLLCLNVNKALIIAAAVAMLPAQ
jgi:hypothetical protein